ncbi:hypothetical protein DFJ73DRAFT_463146 [Zopfochytrium polystomum]|nr:hypothetical protein DFJ73DRAFT_463146 [Zopfochytrium polystomum]
MDTFDVSLLGQPVVVKVAEQGAEPLRGVLLNVDPISGTTFLLLCKEDVHESNTHGQRLAVIMGHSIVSTEYDTFSDLQALSMDAVRAVLDLLYTKAGTLPPPRLAQAPQLASESQAAECLCAFLRSKGHTVSTISVPTETAAAAVHCTSAVTATCVRVSWEENQSRSSSAKEEEEGELSETGVTPHVLILQPPFRDIISSQVSLPAKVVEEVKRDLKEWHDRFFG